jgi:hypothetical protein
MRIAGQHFMGFWGILRGFRGSKEEVRSLEAEKGDFSGGKDTKPPPKGRGLGVKALLRLPRYQQRYQ